MGLLVVALDDGTSVRVKDSVFADDGLNAWMALADANGDILRTGGRLVPYEALDADYDGALRAAALDWAAQPQAAD